MKFKSTPDIVKSKGKRITSGKSRVTSILEKIGVVDAVQLMPEKVGSIINAKGNTTSKSSEINDYSLSNLYLLKVDSTKSVLGLVDDLKAYEDLIDYAEPNFIVTIQMADDSEVYKKEPLFGEQWGLGAVKLPELWAVPIVTSKRPVIAVLDTGVDINHPDLIDNVWANEKELNGYSWADDDNNGYRDDFHGWDFINNCSPERDNNGHGTHCAGIAAATGNNGIGIVGANPNALIMPITVMQSNGQGDIATMIRGINYAVNNGADVISMSFGHAYSSIAESEALRRASLSAVLVAAAGNEGVDIGLAPSFPGAYSFVLGVQSTDRSGYLSSFSNSDSDGPWLSAYTDAEGYNYELAAPGSGILSTYPGGTYKVLSGTSMACPLAAGAISRLLQVKNYDRQDYLWVDLIHTQNTCLDIFGAYQLQNQNLEPLLSITSVRLDDSLGDNDGHADAGEVISLYPTIKNFRGRAENIKLSVNTNDEDVQIIQNDVDFGFSLDTSEGLVVQTPIRIKISDNCKDGKPVSISISATCDGLEKAVEQKLYWTIDNGIELAGPLHTDLTLYPNRHYIVTSDWNIAPGVTVNVKPGTVIKVKKNVKITCDGIFNAIGTKDSLIIITNTEDARDYSFKGMCISEGKFEYVKFNDLKIYWSNSAIMGAWNGKQLLLDNCIFYKVDHDLSKNGLVVNKSNIIENCGLCNSLITDCHGGVMNSNSAPYSNVHNNIINNEIGRRQDGTDKFLRSNIFSNYNNSGNEANWFFVSNSPIIKELPPVYMGTAKENIAHTLIRDVNNPDEGVWSGEGHYRSFYSTYTAGIVDFKNLLTEPDREAHGIVWKVLVDGYDARDEYEDMPLLGIGTHRVDVYFNRPMDMAYPPTVSMGPIEPFTQVPINNDGKWNSDGTIYTVYFDIDSKISVDGENRIYVRGAQDFDHFPIPEEKHRYNVMIQSMNSLNTNLIAAAGCGNIRLTWVTDKEDMPDLMGYDIYRYTIDEWGNCSDSVKVNSNLIDPDYSSYTDYNVSVGETYYYYVVQMSTQFVQRLFSNTVSCRVNTGLKGDANANSIVDVADIISEVSYILNKDPYPFLYEAADVNSDGSVNVLDVIGTINIIMNPSSVNAIENENKATYMVENGTLYIESEVALGGVQVVLKGNKDSEYELSQTLSNMEQATAWIDDNHFMLLAYSMSGRSIPAGKFPVMHIGDFEVEKVVLSDTNGRNINVYESTLTSIDVIERSDDVSDENVGDAVELYDLSGKKINSLREVSNSIICVKKNNTIVKKIISNK